jgi:NTE family protein
VLSGGGARGLAHIGVLRVLQEQRIPIDVIAATSMGAIVGGAYAAGLTPEQMQAFVLDVDWDTVLASRPPRQDLHWRRKADDGRNLSKFEFGIGRDGLSLPGGALDGHELEEMLRRLTAAVQDVNDLRRLPIPFVAMATDLETGAAVELRNAPLSQAMRASMSIPGAFAPVSQEGRLLVDGGLVANLPVQVARQMGADIVIAVNVGTPLAPRKALGTALGVAQQMVNILTEKNVEASKRDLRATDVLIEPDFGGMTIVDFSKAAQIIALGEQTARAALGRLQPLAAAPQDYATFEARRTARPGKEAPVRVAQVAVTGLQRTNPETVKAQVDLPADRYVGAQEIRDAVRQVNAELKFERVDYRLDTIGDSRTLVIQPVEKLWGPHTLRLGGLASTNFSDENSFYLVAAHTLTDVNAWGAEWRNELQLGNALLLSTELYQPLRPGSRWFVLPGISVRRTSADVFAGDDVVGRVQTTQELATLRLGYTLPRYGFASVGRGLGRVQAETLIAAAPQPTARAKADNWNARFFIDRLDSYAFPRSGYLLNAEYVTYDRDDTGAADLQVSAVSWLSATTFGRTTLMVNTYAVRSTREGTGSQLGGFLNLSGTPRGRFAGSRTYFGSLIVYREMSDIFGELPVPLYLGGSLEAGNSADAAGALTWRELKRAGSVFLAADTIAGPFYLGYGHTRGGHSSPYLFWGLFWGRF